MRVRGLILLFLLLMVIAAFAQDSVSNEMLGLLNTARGEAGAGQLYFNPQLQAAAQAHSDDMAASETLAHLGTDGSQFWQRIQDTGYPLITGAENVLSRGDSNAAAAFQQWYNSEAHRLNMLNPIYLEVGIAYTRSATGRYYFTMVLASRDNFIAPTAQAATLVPSSSPLPSLSPTFTPSPTRDGLALTIAAPLPTNTVNPTQVAAASIRTNTPLPPTATEVLPPDIRLVYNNRSFSLINVSGRVLNLANIAFESASGSMPASRWNNDFLSQPLTSFTSNDCVQAWSAEFDLLPKPAECRVRHGWIIVSASNIFWQGSEVFTVLNNNDAIGLCLVSNGVCDVNLSHRLEDIALVNPETVVQPFDLRLEYNNTSFALINVAQRSLDLRGLSFSGAAGSLAIEEWQSQFLSQPLSSFTPNDCLQAWGLNTQEQVKPSDCRYRHAWILVNDSGDFWRDDFIVSRNGILLARCSINQMSCNVSLSANYGAVNNSNESSNSSTNNGSGMRLVIRPESVSLINLSGDSVDISALAFESDNGVFTASRWQIPQLSASLSSFPNGGCLQVWGVGGQMQAVPVDCVLRHAWVAVAADAQFWLNVSVFRVRDGGTVLATCETRIEICDFEIGD